VNYQSFLNFKDATQFPLQALHKVWGDGGGVYNKGVHKQNVYVSAGYENVSFTLGAASVQSQQPVLVMEAHGDLYSGTVPGLEKKRGDIKLPANCLTINNGAASFTPTSDPKGKNCDTGTAMPQCSNWVDVDASVPGWNKRVGGVACTRGQYGPGVYNLLCYIPKTEDTSNDGRGYVFAMWPFHYEEIYKGSQRVDESKAPCFNACDADPPPTVPPPCPSTTACGAGSDVFSTINHEIDIEIPCNSPQLDWKTQMTWDTMNTNTWLNDIDNYDVDSGAYYTQVAVKNPKGNFISTEPESSDNKDYHWYTMDWFVDPTDYTKNYVAFYFDDPWDPSGTTSVTNVPNATLPKQPSGPPLFKTQRFVPTRSGRLNFGPWMGWWGYGGKDGLTPNFDTAKVRMAQLSVTPYSSLWSSQGTYLLNEFPQSYDQPGASCDFQDIAVPKPFPPPPPPSPGTTTTTTKGTPMWVWVVVALAIVVLSLIIWAIVDAVKRKKKAKLSNLNQSPL
jgi:hypothetical protein